MSKIVIVHGIGQQYLGPETLRVRWLPALMDGVALAGRHLASSHTVSIAFYGDLFRPSGSRDLGAPDYDASDVESEFERELLWILWNRAAEVDGGVAGPADKSRARTPHWVQRALYALSGSRFFRGVSERMLIGSLKQVGRYLEDPLKRVEIKGRVESVICDDTGLIIGHSLGSVIAYEALCASARPGQVSLITLGSPLGIPGLIFERLEPRPIGQRGQWPRSVQSWTNIADSGDVVALAKTLNPLFDGPIVDILVHNGATAHDICPYLTAKETGRAVSHGLSL